ncbi:MAG TPA: cytochrome c biogenesis protein DipZ [Thermoleophilaceae bacterium]|jgi:cytochrome c biogenesis protein CcdA/thiol-disulfide isomerase/thioredoxin
MALLIVFAFVAGVGTALSPCVLPVLPLALSAGATGGPRRPLGVVTGLVVTFTFTIVGLVYAIDALGLPDDLLRDVAIGGLVLFGLALALPPVAERMEAALSALSGRVARRRAAGDERGGFASGLAVGAGLGLVYAPCAGPILAGVITVSASQPFSGGRLATALAYALGSAVALYALMLGGRRVTRRLSARAPRLQQVLGAVMVVTAALMIAKLDLRFQDAVAKDLPAFLVDPSSGLQESGAVERELAGLRGRPSGLPDLAPAPEIRGTQRWFNTPGGRPLSLAALRGRRRVVLIDFWTYTCINCIRTLPEVTAWDRRYRDRGLTVIGVHTPEFPFEKDAGNVAAAIERHDIRYPVAQDNDFATWNAFANQYWPAKYLIDARGRVRYAHFGEGDYDATERAIRSLLAERDDRPLGAMTRARAEQPDPGAATPETYLGADRAEGFVDGPLVPGAHDFGRDPPDLPPNGFALRGRWTVGPQSARAGPRARIHLRFQARRVFLVLGSPDRPRRVLLDGRPLPDRLAGPDVRGGVATIDRQRLYRLVDLGRAGQRELTLEPAPGVEGYAFTFG